MEEVFMRYIHFLSLMALSSSLIAEYIILSKEVTEQ
jgi:uncharacterized membrane protein